MGRGCDVDRYLPDWIRRVIDILLFDAPVMEVQHLTIGHQSLVRR